MKKLIYVALLCVLTVTAFSAENEHVTKEYKFKFKAGAGGGLNFFKQNDNEISYKKAAIGNCLGTELGYNITQKISVNAHYYMYYYKNEVKNDAPFLAHEFEITQQNHFIAASIGFTVMQKKNSSMIINTGPGIVMRNEQYVDLNPITKAPGQLGYRKVFKYAQPISFSFENFVKNKIILGVSVQTFLLGEKRPFNGAYIFTYLGLPF
jgi:hypothetical protein